MKKVNIILMLLVMFLSIYSITSENEKEITSDTMILMLNSDKIGDVYESKEGIVSKSKGSILLKTKYILKKDNLDKEDYADLKKKLKDYGLKDGIFEEKHLSFAGIIGIIGEIILIGVFVILGWFLIGQATGSNIGGLKKRDYLVTENPDTKLSDVAGLNDSKHMVLEIIDFIKTPEKYIKTGVRIPRGVIMYGPPGNGKTLLAKAMAGEIGIPFYSVSGSEFIELYAGQGSRSLRTLFDKARKNKKSIIFIDEIDAIGGERSSGINNDERLQTLNQLLKEMDGFQSKDSKNLVIVIGATNRIDILDKALLRPGRFDRKISINAPNYDDRLEILRVHSKDKESFKNISLKKIANMTSSFSGAELENLINESLIRTSRRDSELTEFEDVQSAFDDILMGGERTLSNRLEKEREIAACHETGHAFINLRYRSLLDPLHKLSIVQRGSALGVTVSFPENDKYLYTKEELEAQIKMLMGGRAAEFVTFNSVTTGASNDLERASKIARQIVTNFGMDSKVGLGVFQGEEFLSESTKDAIDSAVKDILSNCWNETKDFLEENKSYLKEAYKLLLKKETMVSEDLKEIVKDCIVS